MRVLHPQLHRRLFGLTVGLVATAALGCGGGDGPARKPTFPAKGTARFEGKPLAHGLLVFHPVGGGKDTPKPRAMVREDGSFVVGTYDGNDGAPAGDYVVTAEWWLARARKEEAELPPTNRLPRRYAGVPSSGIKVQIKEGENELPAIQLRK